MKRIYISVAVILLVVMGWKYYDGAKKLKDEDDKFFQNTKEITNKDEKTMTQEKILDKENAPNDSTPSSEANVNQSYLLYTPNAFSSSATPMKLLFFYASWCPTCRPVDSDIKANAASIPSDLTIFRVNYNDPDTDANEKELAKKYGITYQHTFVLIDTNGNELKKWNGGNFEEILSKIK